MELITTNNNQTSLNDLWSSLFQDFNYLDTTNNNETYSVPKDNILESKEEYLIELMLPGFKKEEINVNLENNKLIILSNKENQDTESLKVIKKGFNKSEFRKEYKLPVNIDKKNIHCTFVDGILSVKLAKKNTLETSQKIKIK